MIVRLKEEQTLTHKKIIQGGDQLDKPWPT